MASPLSPIRAPRQLCGLCFVYRVSDEGDACDSCCSDSPATAAADRYVPSTQRARAELGLEQWIPLEDAIRRTLRFHRGA